MTYNYVPTLQILRFFKVSEPYEEIDRANGKIDHKIEQLYFTFVIFKSSFHVKFHPNGCCVCLSLKGYLATFTRAHHRNNSIY